MAKTPRHPHFDHSLPHWVDPNSATFFITITTRHRGINHLCKDEVGADIINAARKYHDERRWFCSIIVLMPDHVHMLVTMAPDRDLSKTVGMWKRWISKRHGVEWQPNFFDHRLRREESADEKGRYIFHNPERDGLIARAEDWPWTWMPELE